jgi:NTE family protein
MLNLHRKKVGLALSGGGAKGFAHIGVLKVLEENNIPIDFISGTSMGAVIGALYSAEPNAKKLEKSVLDQDFKNIFDYVFPKLGLIKGDRIENFLEKVLHNLDFKDLKIPLFVTSFDLEKNQEIIFHKGNVSKAVRASISFPGIFVPVENKNRILVDGGVFDPVPTEVLKKFGAEIIIASNVNFVKEKSPKYNEIATLKKSNKKIPNIIECASKSLHIIESEFSKFDLIKDKADFVINLNLEKIEIFDLSKAKQAISIGEKVTRKSLKEIKNLTEPNLFKNFLDDLNKITLVKDN